jgi:hypothetical protein
MDLKNRQGFKKCIFSSSVEGKSLGWVVSVYIDTTGGVIRARPREFAKKCKNIFPPFKKQVAN